MRMLVLTVLLLGTSCNLPPKDPFVAAERALRCNDLLRALQAYDTVPVAHVRYPDARAAAGDVEQRMRRCHELILDALMLRSEWRDAEALDALQRARQHWPQQPNLKQWIAATEKRMQLFAERDSSTETPVAELPASPIVEVAKIGRPQLPVADLATSDSPVSSANTGPVAEPSIAKSVASNPRGVSSSAPHGKPIVASPESSTTTKPSPVNVSKRLPTGEDPVARGLVVVESRLGRGELALAVRDLFELSGRFSDDVRVNRRLSRLLHQRALMSYGQGSVAASVTDWRRVLEIEPDNLAVKKLLQRAVAESRAEKGAGG